MANDGRMQGKQQHAEGQHGEKTHRAFIDGLQNGQRDEEESEGIAKQGSPYGATESDGKHRLDEGREQHDEAEKGSEVRKTSGDGR